MKPDQMPSDTSPRILCEGQEVLSELLDYQYQLPPRFSTIKDLEKVIFEDNHSRQWKTSCILGTPCHKGITLHPTNTIHLPLCPGSSVLNSDLCTPEGSSHIPPHPMGHPPSHQAKYLHLTLPHLTLFKVSTSTGYMEFS